MRAGNLARRTTLCALFLGALAAAPASAQVVEDNCDRVDQRAGALCHGVEQVAGAVSAACRWSGAVDEERCPTIGPRVSSADVDAYERSWTHRALGLQFALAHDVPFRDAPWVGTHNSYNSTAEMGPTLSDTDHNQHLALVDQLRLDVRSLELDVHTFPSASAGGPAPVVCHARGREQAHAGCSVEKPLGRVLREIAGWLRAPENRDQVLLLYLEDHLEGESGHDAGAAALERELGPEIYRPAAGGASCAALPLDLARREVLAAGKQVVVVSGCGEGAAWRGVVFDWSSHLESRPRGYTDFPDCGSDFTRAQYDSNLIRYFEDHTGLTAGASVVGAAERDDGITPETAARMARCGVDLTGMDHLLPDDGRLEALVWSWARDEPGAGDCSIQRRDARWESRDCAETHRAACRSADGAWSLTPLAVTASDGPAACAALGATHAVPRTGYEGQLLRVAMDAAGAPTAWLGQRRSGAGWAPLDARG